MIILPEKKIRIVTPPHTASGNLHKTLCVGKIGAIWFEAEHIPDNPGDHHVIKCSRQQWENYGVVLVVRHPLDRLIGLYKHLRFHWSVELSNSIPHCKSFDEFVGVVGSDLNIISWFYRYTICRLIGNQKIDYLVRFENLEVELSDILKENISLLPAYPTKHDDWRLYYNEKTLHVAKKWAKDDLERFGYEC